MHITGVLVQLAIWKLLWRNYQVYITGVLVQYLDAIVEQLSGVYYWCIGTAIWKLSWSNYLVYITGVVLVQLSGSYRGATIWCILLVYRYSYLEAIVEQLSGVYYWCIGSATKSYCVIDWNICGCGSENGK